NEECVGAGLEFIEGSLSVVKVVTLGGPAQRAGVRPGDVITHLDGEPVEEMTPDVVRALEQLLTVTGGSNAPPHPDGAKDPPRRSVKVTLRRPGAKHSFTVTLEPQVFHPELVLGVSRRNDHSWNYLVDPDRRIAHIRLPSLGRSTAFQLREA